MGGGCESALLEGGCVEEDEAEELGGWPWRRPPRGTTTIGSGWVFADHFSPGVLCRAHPSLGTGVDLMRPVLASQTS